MEQQDTHKDCGALVIIRFPADQYQRCINALVKRLPVHMNYSEGEVEGIANYDEITVHEGCLRRDTGLAFLSFNKFDDAQRWTYSVPEIKQPDFLGGIDMILVPCCEHERIHHDVVQVLDLHIEDGCGFKQDYSPSANQILKQHHALQMVSTRAEKVKGQWDPDFLIVNTWESEDCFNQAFYGDQNKELLPKKSSYATTISNITCRIRPLIHKHC